MLPKEQSILSAPRIANFATRARMRTLRRFGLIDLGLDRLGENGTHPGGGRLVEPVDGDDAVDHVGGHLGERSTLEPHRDHRPTGVTTDRPERPGDPGWAPEGRDDEPGRPRRCAQATSRLAKEESARFHALSIPCGYDSEVLTHAGEG